MSGHNCGNKVKAYTVIGTTKELPFTMFRLGYAAGVKLTDPLKFITHVKAATPKAGHAYMLGEMVVATTDQGIIQTHLS